MGYPAIIQALFPNGLPSKADYKCAVNLFTTGQSDVATFYDIWQAATAIFAVCGRYGKGGSVRGLGMFSRNFMKRWGLLWLTSSARSTW